MWSEASRHDERNHTGVVTTDALFHCAIRHGALALGRQPSRRSPTWVYHFDHVISFGDRVWLPGFAECVDKVCHSAELPYLFRANTSLAFINASFTPAEERLASTIQSMWGRFAKTGSPATGGWPAFDAANESMMRFTATPASSADEAAWRPKCAFWDKLGYRW